MFPQPPPTVASASPLVYQQLASGQIQMYQLPPGFVPVLVANPGSLTPLVSLPTQATPTPSQPMDSLAVSAENGRRISSQSDPGLVLMPQAAGSVMVKIGRAHV